MYGNLRRAASVVAVPDPDLEEGGVGGGKKIVTLLVWRVVLLLAAELASFALLLTPLLPDTTSAASIKSFWRRYELLALAACGVYVLLTLPVAAGYTWVIQRWPLNFVTWILIVLSLGTVVHIASVSTDPQGVFVGSCSVSTFLMALALWRSFFLKFSISPLLSFLVGLLWQLAVFVPIYLTGSLSGRSSLGSCGASVICIIFITAELRMIDRGVLIGLEEDSQRDPFTVAIWINCATWRFVVQAILLSNKFWGHLLVYGCKKLGAGWTWVVSKFLQKTPTNWWTPTTARKVVNIVSTDSAI